MDVGLSVVSPSSEEGTIRVRRCWHWPSRCFSSFGRPFGTDVIRIRPCMMILIEYVAAVLSAVNFSLTV
jgi:hypothetical protein